ncbi:MAG TPA: pyridoxal 5'-phosphate synthase [Solirubrobacteraceae bacterium]|nr:pyridoxal 5'-phosphate synthase [Solirubrobacteraceae bacterium]
MSEARDSPTVPGEPLALLGRWLLDARTARLREPASVAFVTVGEDARPTARTVSLKRLERDALLFTSALWTRKVRELQRNPHVALLFHWPSLGRQVHVVADATLAERALAEELYDERPIEHRLQTLVSRQGEPIDDLQPLRERHAHLLEAMEAPPACPPDWGAIRVVPRAVEFWSQAADRLHDRLLYERDVVGAGVAAGRDRGSDGDGGGGWRLTRLSP